MSTPADLALRPTLPLDAAKPIAAKPAADPKLAKAAKEFEAVLLQHTLAALQKTAHIGDGTGGAAGGMYSSMIVTAMSDAIAATGGMGLAQMLVKSVQRESGQEQAQPRAGPEAATGGTTNVGEGKEKPLNQKIDKGEEKPAQAPTGTAVP